MKKLLPKKSKRGVTLVECVIAVVLLGLLAVGVLNLLTAGGTKIAALSKVLSPKGFRQMADGGTLFRLHAQPSTMAPMG